MTGNGECNVFEIRAYIIGSSQLGIKPYEVCDIIGEDQLLQVGG